MSLSHYSFTNERYERVMWRRVRISSMEPLTRHYSFTNESESLLLHEWEIRTRYVETRSYLFNGAIRDRLIRERVVFICVTWLMYTITMGWLRSGGLITLQVSFAEYCLFYRALLQKRPIILSILLSKATPYTRKNTRSRDTFVFLQRRH